MPLTGPSIDDAWRSYFDDRATDAVRSLLEDYPKRRSLNVDVIELHQHDADLVEALFADPDDVLRRGARVLRAADDRLERVSIRLESVPSQLDLDAIRARHADGLVTVHGVIESVGPVAAALSEAAFRCPACGAVQYEHVVGHDLPAPGPCPECDARPELELDRTESTLVDVQQVDVVGADRDEEAGPEPSMTVWLADELVGRTSPGDTVRATGIVRLDRREGTTRYDFSLDAIGLDEQRAGRRPDRPAPDPLKETIRNRWEDAVSR